MVALTGRLAREFAAAAAVARTCPPGSDPAEEASRPARVRADRRASHGGVGTRGEGGVTGSRERGDLDPRRTARGLVVDPGVSRFWPPSFSTRIAAHPRQCTERRCRGSGIVGGSPGRSGYPGPNRPRPIGPGPERRRRGARPGHPSAGPEPGNGRGDVARMHLDLRCVRRSRRSQASASKRRSASSWVSDALHSFSCRSASARSLAPVSSSSACFCSRVRSRAVIPPAAVVDAVRCRASVSSESRRSSTRWRSRLQVLDQRGGNRASRGRPGLAVGVSAVSSPACEDHPPSERSPGMRAQCQRSRLIAGRSGSIIATAEG